MGKIKKGVKKFQKKLAGGGVHKKKKLHFRRDKAEAAKAAEERATFTDPTPKSTGTVLDSRCITRFIVSHSSEHMLFTLLSLFRSSKW